MMSARLAPLAFGRPAAMDRRFVAANFNLASRRRAVAGRHQDHADTLGRRAERSVWFPEFWKCHAGWQSKCWGRWSGVCQRGIFGIRKV